MKKIILVVSIIVFTIISVSAQEVFNKGDKAFNLGIGVPRYGGLVPSLNLSGEVGVIPTGNVGVVSFGGEAEYKFSTYYGILDNYAYHQFSIGGRGAWHAHFFNNPKYDLYAGFSAGFYMYSDHDYYYDASTNSYEEKLVPRGTIYVSEFVGARYMSSDSFGFFGEFSYGNISFARIGFTFLM